jgi:hypothetical protein
MHKKLASSRNEGSFLGGMRIEKEIFLFVGNDHMKESICLVREKINALRSPSSDFYLTHAVTQWTFCSIGHITFIVN